jgi:ATP-binding cassette subfamily B multidrug efflux pump
MLKYLLRHRWRFVLALLLLLVVDGVQLLVPMVVKEVINSLQEYPRPAILARSFFIIVAIALIMFVMRVAWRSLLVNTAHRIVADLRQRMYHKVVHQNQLFFSRWESGDLMARATNDMSAVRMLFSFGVVSMFDTIVLGASALAFMIYLSPSLTLVAVLPLPLLALIVYLFESRIHNAFRVVQERFSTLTTFVQEAFSGIFVVKAFCDEKAQEERFAGQNELYVAENLKLARLNALFDPLLALVIALSTVLVLYFGGRSVIRHEFTLGQLVAFIAYLETLAWPVMAVGFSVNIYQRGSASLRRIEELSEMPLDVRYERGSREGFGKGPVAVELRDLSFAYAGREPVLRNISLRIGAGTTVGIIGRVGSGKSTLLRLLSGTIPVEPGVVFFNGSDVNSFELNALREGIGAVPQEPFLFSMSVAENIAFLEPSASADEIASAARIADMEQSIEAMPERYETLLGERGVNLSGGQKQRMTIARAVLREFPLLLLDDCFSSIDTETEERILTRMKPIIDKATTIIVSHRVSTLRYADLVLVLDDGRVVEQGTPAELLDRRGHYFDLVQKQQLSEKIARLD